MTAEELKKKADALNSKMDEFNNLVAKCATTETMEAKHTEVLDKIKELPSNEYVTKMQEQLDDMTTKMDDIIAMRQAGISVNDQLDQVFKSEGYKNAKENKGTSHQFELKASTINTANSFTETASPIIPYDRDPLVESDPKRVLVFQQIMSRGSVNQSDYIDWVERTSETTGTAMKKENQQFGQSDISWTSHKRAVEKITDSIKVNREKLEDTDWVRSEIMDVLNYNLPFKLEEQILDGNGTSPNLEGMLNSSSDNYIKPFDAPTGIEGMVSAAQRYSALKAAMLQVELGNTSKTNKTGFLTTHIVTNPTDYYLLSEEKDNEGRYLYPGDTPIRIMGVPVLKSQFLSSDEFVVGNFSLPKIYTRRNVTIRMWEQNSDDPVYDRVTFTATWRGSFRIKEFQKWGLVTGTYTNAINEINKAVA